MLMLVVPSGRTKPGKMLSVRGLRGRELEAQRLTKTHVAFVARPVSHRYVFAAHTYRFLVSRLRGCMYRLELWAALTENLKVSGGVLEEGRSSVSCPGYVEVQKLAQRLSESVLPHIDLDVD